MVNYMSGREKSKVSKVSIGLKHSIIERKGE
jgi:hypothetical protein